MAIAAHCASFTVDNLTFTILDDAAHTVQLTKVSSQDAELKIPETVEYEGVTYTVTSVNLSLSAYSSSTGKISIVTVPKTVEEIVRLKGSKLTSIQFAEGSRLKTIGNGAFSSNKFEEISLPESVETIEAYAFQSCSKLTAIDIPDNITTIKAYTFDGCTALTDIKLPSTLTVIENRAFYSSRSMQRAIVLPASLTSIGSSSFSYAELHPTGSVPPTLESGAFGTGVTVVIDDPSLVMAYLNADGWKDYVERPEIVADGLTYKIKSASEAELIAIPYDQKIITIPASINYGELQLAVTSIKDGALSYGTRSNHNVAEEIYIKAPVSSIGRQDFGIMGLREPESCLKHIELPESLQRIEDYTFENCTQLKSIDIPDNVEYIGRSAFASSAIETFTAPSKLTEIGNYMFQLSSLKTVTLHDNIKAITDGAFYGCSELTELALPAGLETIKISALGGTAIAELRIPHTVSDISLSGSYSYMPDSLKNIFITGGSNDKYFDLDGVLFRKVEGTDKKELMCYPSNRGAAEYTVPDGTVGILEWAFGRNSGETDYDPTPLKRVILPESIVHIDSYAFAFNHSLTDINLPKNLTSIGTHAFHFDRQLTVRIPESVTYVGDYAFGVNTIYIDAIQPPSCAYSGNPFDGTICVKPEAVDAYKNHEAWGKCRVLGDFSEQDGLIYVANGQTGAELAGYVKMPGGTFDIPQTVTIDGKQRSLTALGEKALNRAYSINTVNVPETVDSIGAECFRLCGNMTSANIGSARVKWPNFLGCNKMQEVTADENNIYHTTKEGVLYSKAMDTLQYYPLGAEREAYLLPESVTAIGDYLMDGFEGNGYKINLKLQKFYSLSQTPPACSPSSFSNNQPYSFTLYVPENLLETYQHAIGWNRLMYIKGLSDEEIDAILAGVKEVNVDGNNRTDDGVFYTIGGQRVTKPGKGLYIRNGKKVVIK